MVDFWALTGGMRELKKTGITNLWRSENGTYYLVAKIGGKRVVRSLRTSKREAARELLPGKLKAEKDRLARAAGLVVFTADAGDAEVGSWKGVLYGWLEFQQRRPDLQERTRDFYGDMVAYALRWLEGDALVSRSTRREMELWWQIVSEKYAERTANNMLAAVRGALELAEESGVEVPTGLMAGCRKLKIPPRELVVPTNDDLEAILLEVESTGRPTAEEARDLIEFLAFVGCRIGEAREVTWGDVKRDEILIRGKENERGRARTKGGDFRRVPIADRVGRLLKRRKWVGARSRDRIFQVKSPKRSLEGACRRLKLPHLRVHDLRHFFATHCIERGVDIPTVAGWLGHKDGGVLAMKTYGHVRNEHSRQMGKRIG